MNENFQSDVYSNSSAQPIRLEYELSVEENVAYALVLTPKLISNRIDGQRHFDLF